MHAVCTYTYNIMDTYNLITITKYVKLRYQVYNIVRLLL